ncbi:oligosaccharide flippase family protein [Pseudomonas anuradhapurensis]|uniref:oligosaccharide flippase family protein n=1 Tax=Pseudomonas anuradhapurensis TaxID=485870 RepID=UPI001647E320|nr:oligosaccharide flippase family protein [Pseudomonas anuradhapurensis]QXI49215.1 oligosaccharide flippase family protein [Pseudomonas anuradhapurensis]
MKNGKSDFLRNVLTLMTGTTLAQAIPIAAMPLLTRLYTPEDFGVLALYMSIAGMISVVITARYEIAVMLPEREEDAASLVALSVCIAGVISLVLLAVILVFNEDIQGLLNNRAIGPWLYLLPITVFVTGMWQAFNYWNNRAKKFKRLAVSRVAQGGGMTLAQFVLTGLSAGGLVVGYLVGQISGLLVFITRTWREDRTVLSKVSLLSMLENARRYSKFPKYSMLGALLDNAAVQMPVLMLSKFYDTHVVGIFSLTFRALNLPMSLIATSFSQVLFQRFVVLQRDNPERLAPFVLKLFVGLLGLMVPLVAFVWILGPDLFALVFGESWRQAGDYATILIFAVAIRFAVSPLSTVLAMDHNIKIGTLWQMIYFVTISLTLFIFRNAGIETFLLAFTLHEVALYSLYLGFIIFGAKRHRFG